MHKHTFALLAVTILTLPLSLRACDDECDNILVLVHFHDGLTPNGPTPVCARLGDPSYYKCGAFFVFHDYGPVRVPVPPAPPPVVQHRKIIGT